MPGLSIPRRPDEDNMLEQAKSNNKRLALHLLAAAVPFGIIDGLMGLPETEPRLLTLAEGIVINFILFYWFMVDSGIRNYAASRLLKFMVVILGPIALFVYIIRTRGARGSIKSFVFALGLGLITASVSGIVAGVTSGLVEDAGLR
jgi:hypothetical protein